MASSVVAAVGILMLMAVVGILVMVQLDESGQSVSLEGTESDVPSMVQNQLLDMDSSMFSPPSDEVPDAKEEPSEDFLQLETVSGGVRKGQPKRRASKKIASSSIVKRKAQHTSGKGSKKDRKVSHGAFERMAKAVTRHMRSEKFIRARAGSLEMKLERSQQQIRRMREIDVLVKKKERREKAERRVLERSGGSRMRESQTFQTYMTRWWRLHRNWMKRHNIRLYQKLRQHRALSLSRLWKPFLLRWKYVQPRKFQGFRYNWKDDGTYEVKRFLMKSKKKLRGKIVAAKVRSVNNLCFPGFLPPRLKHKSCTYSKPVSSRAVQFVLQRLPFKVISIATMRAYSVFTPRETQRVAKNMMKGRVRFVSIQSIRWEIHELIEYCEERVTVVGGASVPGPFHPETSSPKRSYALKYMEWDPITMERELQDNGSTVEKMLLRRSDGKIKISCIIPVKHPQSIYGEEVNLTTEKCTFYFNKWNFDLKCPGEKMGSLALSTKVTSRDTNGSGGGAATLTPRFEGQLAYNRNKISMQFEQEAVIHTTAEKKHPEGHRVTAAFRNSVPVIMTQGKSMEWNSDPRFRHSRRVFFSFIVSDVRSIKNGIVKWDPEVNSSFKNQPQVLDKANVIYKDDKPPAEEIPRKSSTRTSNFELPSFMQMQASPSSSAARSLSLGEALMAIAISLAVVQHL